MNLKKIFAGSLAVMMPFMGMGTAFCEEKPVMEIYFDGKNYSEGDIVNADIIVYNTTYNVLGFSLKYGENVTVVDENGETTDNEGALIKVDDAMYRGEGIYSILSTDVSDDSIRTVMYVNPASEDEAVKNNSVTVGSDGRKIAELTFRMTKDGIPDVSFATVENDPEFASTAFFMLSDGTQPAGSVSRVRFDSSDEEKKPDDNKKDEVSKTEDDKKDEEIVNKDPEDDKDAPDKAEKNDAEKNDDEKKDDVIINTIVPENDPTVTGGDAVDISDIASDNTLDGQPVDTVPENEKEITPLQRILGIATLGIAFGFCGGVVLKKIMSGAKKED